jgi:hypothetical protein
LLCQVDPSLLQISPPVLVVTGLEQYQLAGLPALELAAGNAHADEATG